MEGSASVYNVIKILSERHNVHSVRGVGDHDDIDYIHKSFWQKFPVPKLCDLQFLDEFYCISLRKEASLTLFEQLNQWRILNKIGTFSETFFSQETFRTHLSFDFRHALSFFSNQLSAQDLEICEKEILFRLEAQNVSLTQALNEFYQTIYEITTTSLDSETLFEWYCLGGQGLCNPNWSHDAIKQKTKNILKRRLHDSEWHKLTKAVKFLLLFDKRVLMKRLVSCLKVKKKIPINTLFSTKSQTYSEAMDYSIGARSLLNINSVETSLDTFKTPKETDSLLKVFDEKLLPEEVNRSKVDSTSALDHLYTLCNSHRNTTEDALEMLSEILEIFLSPHMSTDVVIERLVDLFGLDQLNVIEFFLQKKEACVDEFLNRVQKYLSRESFQERDDKVSKSEPLLGCNIQFVKSCRDKKVFSKGHRQSTRQRGNNSVEKFLVEHSLTHVLRLLNMQDMKFTQHESIPVDQSFMKHLDEFKPVTGVVFKSCLPPGATHEKSKGIEIFHLPAAQPIHINKASLVSIAELPQWAHVVFSDITTFNIVQSKVFQCVFNSQNNFLVSAPTGCGKSNIALVAILSSLEQYQSNSNIFQCPKPENFRVVYIAPMKSLVSEITRKYSKALSPLGIKVQELTSDVHISREELSEVHIVVTVCEKFDILTRKVGYRGVSSENSLMSSLKCVIFDEIHLLNDDRGSILEAVVARILRYMETAQQFIRLIGLSATLPNWNDIGDFLHVATENRFNFNQNYRPIPLDVSVIGLNSSSIHIESRCHFDSVCYNNVVKELREGGQILIFVHSRNQTMVTAEDLIDRSSRNSDDKILFSFSNDLSKSYFELECRKAKDHRCLSIMQHGVGVHHAGLSMTDRRLIESLFSKGYIKVLVSTSTLAWGVNLPARCVIIRGTQFFDTRSGSDQSLNILDILQMFGRAGRPQFDTTGKGILITNHDKMSWYLNLLTNQIPIESQLYKNLNNALNAEISIGTIQYEEEGIRWLSYTYLYIRMLRDPIKYGLKPSQIQSDTTLNEFRRSLISQSAQYLEDIRMIRISGKDNAYNITEFGRIAAEYYIDCDTAVHFMKRLKDIPDGFQDLDVLETLGDAKEFESLTVRSEELDELYTLQSQCHLVKKNKTDTCLGKVIILIQVYLKRLSINCSSLVADVLYISQNIPRLARGLLEMSLSKCLEHPGNSSYRILEWCKLFERRLPYKSHVLRHFCYPDVFRETKRIDGLTSKPSQELYLNEKIVTIFEKQGLSFDIIKDMSQEEIQNLVRKKYDSRMVLSCLRSVPVIKLQVGVRPITNRIAQFALTLESDFVWNSSINGNVEVFRIWVEDPQSGTILFTQEWRLLKSKRHLKTLIEFVLPLYNKTGDLHLTPQYFVHVVSDRWVGIGFQHEFSVHHLIIPDHESRITPLLNLHPLPITCLKKKEYENLYSFDYFNPIQTQIFHTLYHTNQNVLLGAPTGSGKTIAAEFALFHLFNNHPNSVAIYIAPLKALAKERMEDWKCKFEKKLGKKVTELTGDITPDIKILNSCHIIVTTPEKFDGISRLWRKKDYLHRVFLVILDEIHLLGLSRGPVLEILVSRLRCMSYHMHRSIRLVGLSTALANVKDVAEWLGVNCRQGLFNFSPSVRPVPCETHIRGFSEKHYCPRMASMNKPVYTFIQNFSENKPVLIFVSSRRQTRLTALDLIALRMIDTNAKDETSALHQNDEFLQLLSTVTDTTLQYTLQFGIALHHAGLHIKDRAISETLFKKNYARILITTSTLAWGVNLPAHLVIIKGTEIYDAKTKNYIDMPLTDVLQMIGRAGRPQFDQHAVVGLFVQESKKLFYRTFIYEPFPLESSLHQYLDDHINAEISNGTITCGVDMLNYITWTYFFRRLLINPDYYMNELYCLKKNETTNVQDIKLSEHGYEKPSRLSLQHSTDCQKDSKKEKIARYLETLFLTTIQRLQDSKCVQVEYMHYTSEQSTKKIERQELQLIASVKMHKYKSTFLGDVACRFYVTVQTVCQFDTAMTLHSSLTWVHILHYVCNAPEYQQLPVRHNEDKMNEEFSQLCFIMSENSFESPHCKAFLLLQAHLFSLPLPITDYVTDLKSVLDQCIRILLCFLHIALWKQQGMTFLHGVLLLQSIFQGLYPKANPLLCVPTLKPQATLDDPNEWHIKSLPEIIESDTATQLNYVTKYTTCPKTALKWIQQYPKLRCSLSLVESSQDAMYRIHFYKSHHVHFCVFDDTMNLSRESYQYNIHLCLYLWYTNQPSHEIYSDVFSRPLPYTWFIVLLDSETYQVMYHTCLKNVSCNATLPSKHDLDLRVTLREAQSCHWKCLLLSDTFMGCDQEVIFAILLEFLKIKISMSNSDANMFQKKSRKGFR